MARLVLIAFFVPFLSFAQIRLEKLEIQPRDTFKITGTDILVVDTLIMRDSSVIKLNRKNKDNFIHAKAFVAGNAARIIGRGEKGDPGKNGGSGIVPGGPCLDGKPGRGGTGGTHGESGTNLFLYLHQFTITGTLQVELSGGDGGDGGNGGAGGGGSPATRVCQGGNGGNGGNGGTGGNGGNGGTLTISYKSDPDPRIWLGEKLLVRSFGGYAGIGGEGGIAGLAGLSVDGDNGKDGKIGPRGKKGADGQPGKEGAIIFERN